MKVYAPFLLTSLREIIPSGLLQEEQERLEEHRRTLEKEAERKANSSATNGLWVTTEEGVLVAPMYVGVTLILLNFIFNCFSSGSDATSLLESPRLS